MFRLISIGRLMLIGAAAAMVATACGGSSPPPGSTDIGSGTIQGAGATFPGPFYTKAFLDYTSKHPNVIIDYQAVGSGAGIQQFIKKTVDFGASDVPMGAADITNAGGADSLTQIPTTLGVIAITYHLSGIDKLQLDGPTLANIYLKHITRWNDPALTALNPGVNLPNKAIMVQHRSDGSGTTFHFTDYLAKVSDEWKNTVLLGKGPAKSIKWPVGNGGSGNAAVANNVIQTDGAIGYVELAFVVQNKMQQAYLKNADGSYVQASVAGATAAAAQNNNVSPTNFSITNEPGATTYPIAAFSWVILRTSYSDAGVGRAIAYVFKWLVTDGQTDGAALQYAPLPTAVQNLALTNLKLVKAGGTAVLS
jgi:phosphate transport system substrate-binding protein